STILSGSYTAGAAILCLAPSLVVLVGFRRAKIELVRVLWRIQALGMLVAYVLLPLALVTGRVPERFGLTWMSELEIIAACAAVLAWRVRGIVAYIIVWQAIMFAVALLCCDNPMLGRSFGDALRQLFFVSMFACLSVALLRAGRLLDATVADAVREARRSAIAEVRRSARERVQMLVHDGIIVVLLAYASGLRRDRVAEEAATALAEISRGSEVPRVDVPPQQLAWRLQALTTRLDPEIRFDYVVEEGDPIPADVAAAFEEALAEALRNSIRHAGDGAVRQVRADVQPARVDVVVLDDGTGFDPSRVDATRLGIRQGIIQRLSNVDGGEALVRSTPGYGTTVRLVWTP
ncbi:MAG: hypothetical protein QM602_06605, partial [Microbacterium sp.]